MEDSVHGLAEQKYCSSDAAPALSTCYHTVHDKPVVKSPLRAQRGAHERQVGQVDLLNGLDNGPVPDPRSTTNDGVGAPELLLRN